MKILYSHRTRSADGQNVHIRELTKALSDLGHSLDIAAPGGGTVNTKLDASEGSGGLRQYIPPAAYEVAEYGYSVPAYLRLARLARSVQPDILYERYNLYFHAGIWLKKKLDLPMILEVNAPLVEERVAHGDLALESFARKSERAIWTAADMTLPVTDVLADHLRAVGVPEDKICVIHNGVSEAFLKMRDPNLIREQYNLQGKLILGFTGFVRDWHRVDRAIKFLATYPRENVRLMVVGDGPERANLEARAEALEVADQVIFTGVVQRDDLPDYVAAFDVALQPAVVDYASPLKLFEYMALGKAIVAPDSANIREILSDGEDALLFAQDSDEEFEKSLLRLVDDRELRARTAAAARESLGRQDLTWAGNARRVEAIAERLLRGK